jgi:hypothetical protein
MIPLEQDRMPLVAVLESIVMRFPEVPLTIQPAAEVKVVVVLATKIIV